MSPRFQANWEDLFESKQKALLDNGCDGALRVAGLDDLQNSLQSMYAQYHHSGFPDAINRLQPGFQYLSSFSSAITSAAQYDPRACLLWGGVQAVVLSACQSQVILDNTLELMVELNKSLPQIKEDVELFSDSPALHIHLQSIYDAYMEYCITSVKYMKKSGASHFINYFFGSDPASALKTTKAEIKYHIGLFERAAASARHQRMLKAEVQKTLNDAPLAVVRAEPRDRVEEDVHFPVSTIRMFKNYYFLGREQEIEEVRIALNPDVGSCRDPPFVAENDGQVGVAHETANPLPPRKRGKMPACCVIQGLGGMGKTQTALQYYYKYEDAYDATFWVRSDLDTTLASSYASIAGELGLSKDLNDPKGQDQVQAIELARKWLRITKRRWLLIFDNVEDLDHLNTYLPRNIEGEGAIIITTQKLDVFPITDHFKTINLVSLDRDMGADLMFKYLRRNPRDEDEEEFARKVSDLLGGLPLALATIGGYIEQTNDTFSGYYESLRTSSSAWVASAVGPAKQYEKTLATVFAIALKELPADARALIHILAFLSPDHIPEDLFLSRIGMSSFPFLTSKAKFVDTIRSLRQRHLVRRDATKTEPYISIHRTVQWAVLHELSQSYKHRYEVCRQTFDLVCSALPRPRTIDVPEPALWKDFQKHVPQILHLRAHCLWPEPAMKLPVEFAQVLSDMATYMWHAGLLNEATEAMHTAEEILDSHDIGIKNPLRGNIEEKIGIVASLCGVSRRDEVMPRRQRAIAAREASHAEIPEDRVTRDDEIRLWNVQSDLAFGNLQIEEFQKAGIIIERCLEQYEKWGSENTDFEYLKYNHIISYVHMAAGEPLDAIRACKQGAAYGEKCCGPTHPMTQLVRFSLANHLYFAGEVDQSLREHLSVLRARESVLGPYNHFTLESHVMCGAMYAVQGDYGAAEYHFLECLDPGKRLVWDKEGIARAQFLYADVLQRTNRRKEADTYFGSARATRDIFLEKYPQWLKEDRNNELVVFDQMVSLWAGKFTGPLTQTNVEVMLPFGDGTSIRPSRASTLHDVAFMSNVNIDDLDVGTVTITSADDGRDQDAIYTLASTSTIQAT